MDCDSDFKSSENIFENAYMLLFCNDELLVKEHGGIIQLPFMYDINMLNIEAPAVQYIGLLDGNTYYSAHLSATDISAGFSCKKLRQLFGHIAEECLGIAFRAFHITFLF